MRARRRSDPLYGRSGRLDALLDAPNPNRAPECGSKARALPYTRREELSLMPCPRLSSCAAAVLASIGGLANAQTADSKIEIVEVHGNYLNGIGTSDAASQGAVT